MKKTFKTVGYLFLAVLMCVNLTGCGDDGDGLWPFSDSAIVGTWEFIGSSSEDPLGSEGEKIIFYSNGDMKIVDPSYYIKEMKGTYTFDPVINKLIMIPSEEMIFTYEAEVVDYYVFFESGEVISLVQCWLVDEGQADIEYCKDFFKKIK